jgi:hypothetical protein
VVNNLSFTLGNERWRWWGIRFRQIYDRPRLMGLVRKPGIVSATSLTCWATC